MNDETCMRILDGAQHLEEHFEACADIAALLVAICSNRHPRHVLQCEIGLVVRGNTCVVQTCDVGMNQTREDLAFAREALDQVAICECRVEELQRDLTREESIIAFREPYTSHSAAPKQRQD